MCKINDNRSVRLMCTTSKLHLLFTREYSCNQLRESQGIKKNRKLTSDISIALLIWVYNYMSLHNRLERSKAWLIDDYYKTFKSFPLPTEVRISFKAAYTGWDHFQSRVSLPRHEPGSIKMRCICLALIYISTRLVLLVSSIIIHLIWLFINLIFLTFLSAPVGVL